MILSHPPCLTSRIANFKPYTYWHLVILSCPISQHLASVFVFLAVFMRLQERLLDPRALVWISVGVFLAGYMTWEMLDCARADNVSRHTNRLYSAHSHGTDHS